jgi:hypothetical protein
MNDQDYVKDPAQRDAYLPTTPAQTHIHLWQDVPHHHWDNSSMWLHRNLLKQLYCVSERAYFRWLDKLKEHGLNRSLQAKEAGKVKLFYRPDVERATAQLQAANLAAPHRGRPLKAMAAANQQSAESAPALPAHSPTPTASVLEGDVRFQLPHQDVAPSAQVPALAANSEIARLTAALVDLQAQHQALRQQQLDTAAVITSLEQKIANLTAHQTNLAAAVQALSQSPRSRRNAASEIANEMILAAIGKLSRQVNRLAASSGSKIKPAKAAHKKPTKSAIAKTHSPAKAKTKTSSKIKPKAGKKRLAHNR